MHILRIGDMHVKPSNLKESEALMSFILSTAKERDVDRVEFLGDMSDTHGMIRLEVQQFWQKWFELFEQEYNFSTVVLVGNHDLTGSYGSAYSSLHVFKHMFYGHSHEGRSKGLKIVDEPFIEGKYGYLPYIHENAKFVEEANKLAELGATVLISHPNYEGAVYDNGSPIHNPVRVDSLDGRLLHLIGGHIHTELELGRVWYTGTPRWLTKSCSNKRKGIWLCTHDDSGQMTSKEFISTESVCRPIYSLIWKEGEEKPAIPKGATTNLELIGSSEWVTQQKKDLKDEVSLSSKITDIKKSKTRQSGRSLYEFLSKHYQASPEKKQKLVKYLEDLGLV